MTNQQLLQIVRHIDLPHHARAERIARFVVLYSSVVPPVCTFVTWYFVLRLFWRDEPNFVAGSLLLIGAIWVVSTVFSKWYETQQNRLMKFLAIIGALSGALYGYMKYSGLPEVADMAVNVLGFSVAGAVIGMFSILAIALVIMVNTLLQLVGRPFSLVCTSILSAFCNLLLKLTCPAWVGKKKHNWVLRFDESGIAVVNEQRYVTQDGQRPIYVANPKLRRNGLAAAAGIPLFTWGLLSSQPGIVANTMQQAYSAAPEAFDGFDDSFTVLNPTTGLPMVGDTYGGIDIGGNLYGHDTTADFSFDSHDVHAHHDDHFA